MPEITYTVERSFSRKHTYISIQKDGSVLVRANGWITAGAIDRFVQSKAAWITQKQHALQQAQQQNKTHYLLLGRLYERGARTQEEIENEYRAYVKSLIPPLVEQYSKRMALYPTRLSFRKNRSRWGSCSAKNALSFNIQLAQTPEAFIEYVVVHELAHIRHKNHSTAFWELVGAYLPDYKERRRLGKAAHYLL